MPEEPGTPTEAKTKKAIVGLVSAAFNLVGGVAGLIALASLFWFGGALAKQTDINTQDLRDLKSFGSPTLNQHIKADDQRVDDLSRRMLATEESVKQAADLKIEVRVLGSKLDNIAKQLEEIKANAAIIKLQTRP